MRKSIGLLGFLIITIVLSAVAMAGTEGENGYIWSMETQKEVAGYGNDNTGAKFVLNSKIVYQGQSSVEVIPSGEAIETKLDLNLSGDKLKIWNNGDVVVLNVYLPEKNSLNPTSFFLGMADVTGEWKWIDGVFSETEVQPGWNEIRYHLSENMKNLKMNHKYKLYFAFIGFDENNVKVPLTESFYIDGIRVEPLQISSTVKYIWTMDSEKEINNFDDDNTGTRFALNSEIVYQGQHSLAVIPSGEAVETKIALDLVGEKINLWAGNDEVIINIYLPEDNELNPQMFFLGMADVTEEWSWIGGVFSKTEVKPGWNQVRYPLADVMKKLDSSRKYKIYLAFAGFDKANNKIPLTEKFYIDGIYVEQKKALSLEERLNLVPEEIKKEVASLLKMDTEDLLNAVSKKTFDYFWLEANPENGLIKDRSTEDSPCSIAAVGFGLTAIPVGIERGWISRVEGFERILTTLRTFAEGGVEGKNGFFYHFVDMKTGRRVGNSELSSIDTAIFIAGALFAGEYFKGTIIERLAQQLYEDVNWQWMMNDGDTLAMGWKPEAGFLNARWDSFNEGLLAYILAIGSPTYPIPAESWDAIYRPVNDNYINLPMEVLFVYQYPHIWIDFRDKEDKYANYWNNSVIATRINRLFAVLNRYNYKSYDLNIWGISASDGPAGYKAYGASEGNHDGTIAPYASIASMPFTPELSIAAMKEMLKKYGPLIWGKYGFVSAFNVDQNWFSDQHIGIDQGDILLMIENYRTGFVWKYFMQNESIQRALDKIGFVEKKADYAVTPGYQAEFEKMRLAPKDKKAVAHRLEGTIQVDGDLSEWQGQKYYVVDEDMNVPAGGLQKVDKRKQILHSKFYIQWDDKYLYLAADVSDEVVVSNIAPEDKGGYYRTDSIEFYLDPGRAGSDAGIMKLAILPFDTEGNVQAVRHEDAKPGPIAEVGPDIKVASKRTESGYAIEVAIPFADLGIKPKSGTILGFCHTIHNSNKEDAKIGEYVRTNMLAWNNLPEIWANPELWGQLILE
ncbi:hypothetical protein BBF96_10430 [Anoxybacter fermentans]|uniref:Carbohydrate-binding domain-containing protein n=1 Tax=Anoxybacter fermentans TaxID=1323375 RepID=A0A3Q9HQX2_9FIRM|nr:glucoamylase family protein [Anoxybacter fermentans]AZR73764.1 hypothetical protein BBF96_10430 [Anoxybacter fermentans]